jgi:hypothetical protein
MTSHSKVFFSRPERILPLDTADSDEIVGKMIAGRGCAMSSWRISLGFPDVLRKRKYVSGPPRTSRILFF